RAKAMVSMPGSSPAVRRAKPIRELGVDECGMLSYNRKERPRTSAAPCVPTAGTRSGGSVHPTTSVLRTFDAPGATRRSITPDRARSAEPAQMVTRGPLAARAHRLLGLGALGEIRRGANEPALRDAFGGDVATWHHVGTPWIAARSLARPVETL